LGSAAPDFTVRDAERTVTLSQLQGTGGGAEFLGDVVFPCIEEMPSLVQMQQRMKSKA
jgi:hypothetical protein